MLATLVIFLREGVEASMIVTILLAYLDRIGQRRYFRDVVFGVLSASAWQPPEALRRTSPSGTTTAQRSRRSSKP